jgi:hypothetical protein
MELNHQIRLCRPFPFRFGFRAVSHNIGIMTVKIKALQVGQSLTSCDPPPWSTSNSKS